MYPPAHLAMRPACVFNAPRLIARTTDTHNCTVHDLLLPAWLQLDLATVLRGMARSVNDLGEREGRSLHRVSWPGLAWPGAHAPMHAAHPCMHGLAAKWLDRQSACSAQYAACSPCCVPAATA